MPKANPAQRRYTKRIILASLVYAVSVVGETYVVKHVPMPDVLKFAIALIPAIGIVAMIAALGAYVSEEQDEYIRVRTVKQILWGAGLSLGALTLYGFPEQAGLLPHLPSYFATIFWYAAFGITGCAQKLLDR